MISHLCPFCLQKLRILTVLFGNILIFRFFTPFCFFPTQLKEASRFILNSSLLVLPSTLSLNNFLPPNTTGVSFKLFNLAFREDLRVYNPFNRLSCLYFSFIFVDFFSNGFYLLCHSFAPFFQPSFLLFQFHSAINQNGVDIGVIVTYSH